MQTRRLGSLEILTPDLDPRDLDEVTEAPDGDLIETLITEGTWSNLRYYESNIRSSKIAGIGADGSTWEKASFYDSVLERVNLANATFSESSVERTLISGCRLTGVQIEDTTLKDVIFENCRLDYATLRRVNATGAVAFVGCTLVDSNMINCRLNSVLVQDCQLERLELNECNLRGADLRGNDLSGMLGSVTNLQGVTLSAEQLPGLATLTVRTFGMSIGASTS